MSELSNEEFEKNEGILQQNINLEVFNKNLAKIESFLPEMDIIEEMNTKSRTISIRDVDLNDLAQLKAKFQIVVPSLKDFANNNIEYLNFEIRGESLLSITNKIVNKYNNNTKLTAIKLLGYKSLFNELFDIFDDVRRYQSRDKEWEKQTKLLNMQLKNAQKSVENIDAAKLAIEGKETEGIYSEASKNYLEKARQYEILFYLLLFAAGCIAFISFRHFSYDHTNIVDFVLSKLMILTVVVTLGTIFLRKSSHLRKLHDQAHQTSLELQALPLFIKSLEKSDQDEIIKDLSKKYFGKELDQAQNDKIGDLIQDQMKASTDMVKASTEMVKNLRDTKPT